MEDDINIYSNFEKKINSGHDFQQQYSNETREIADAIRKVAENLKKDIEDSPLEWKDKEEFINYINKEILSKAPIVGWNDMGEILHLAEQLSNERRRFLSVVMKESKERKDKEMNKMLDEGPMKWKWEERKEKKIYGEI